MSTGKRSKHDWERFSNFKQRGEWVELQFMAQAALRRFNVSRPWGDNLAYDVGVEHAQNFLRVQVKSTTYRVGSGYLCQFKPNHRKKSDYSLQEIDLFAAYVIPRDVWYLIPAVLLLGRRRRTMAMLCPAVPPAKKASYRYERYREAWNLLTKSRAELSKIKAPPPPPSHHRKADSRTGRKPLLCDRTPQRKSLQHYGRRAPAASWKSGPLRTCPELVEGAAKTSPRIDPGFSP